MYNKIKEYLDTRWGDEVIMSDFVKSIMAKDITEIANQYYRDNNCFNECSVAKDNAELKSAIEILNKVKIPNKDKIIEVLKKHLEKGFKTTVSGSSEDGNYSCFTTYFPKQLFEFIEDIADEIIGKVNNER